MLETVSLDQLRTFIAAATEGSFSAAGRKLRRSQSVVSHTISNLEQQVGVKLFVRESRYPTLTSEGNILFIEAMEVINRVNDFKTTARKISEGMESEVSLVVDIMFPMGLLTAAVKELHESYDSVAVNITVNALGGTVQPLLDKSCQISIIGFLPELPPSISCDFLLSTSHVFVASHDHPLSLQSSDLSRKEVSKHVQLIIIDKTNVSKDLNFGVVSPKVWKLTDLSVKRECLLAGLGWGSMPYQMVKQDIEDKRLTPLKIKDMSEMFFLMPMSVAVNSSNPPGSAGRWLVNKLKVLSAKYEEENPDEGSKDR
ncbi:HTH-type transcriptional activator AllS [Serratia proteamaculans]|uniref:LysR family transcriptional regulator n=1 Tax=Serratia proteamaculans TaxID=28151 RepID=UPI002178F32A|nr:LysR family transcriptional regulator [Serratia proteamaculans]CAI0785627.1 HTH-type transcriptional activator AllS [Serratia proteamaculans]CAI1574221.1 HTH-type transcriptional activator AllS [Serratia proteamaculans]